MAAVVRVKRCLDEEPTSALILSCKRRKADVSNEDSVKTLFKFAGTLENQDENIALLNPNKLVKSDVKASSRPVPNLLKKARTATKASSQSNRYKLVNYFRAIGNLDQSENLEDGNQNSVTVLDVETLMPSEESLYANSGSCGAQKSTVPQYVYDLYYIEPDASKDIDVDDLLLDGLVSFAPVESELVFDTYRNNKAGGGDSDSDSPIMDDDDDSNDENNWRNDYPDDEEGNSDYDGDGDALASGLRKIKFGDEELSSDSDVERLIYTEDLSPSDINLYGSAYARFKKRGLKELEDGLEMNSDSDDCDSSKSGESKTDKSDSD